ncbi:UNVERIFIED_CONTAM: hypothetical protein B566_EDAN019345 [Ephemera danica]|nr:hypothetical protein B566_EDAN019345 [Ephemera danica]
MVNIQKRLQGGIELLQYYTTKEWVFRAEKILQISAQLPIEEQEKFNTDASRVDYDAYMREAMLGTRKYILKDDLSTLPKARRHMRRYGQIYASKC